MRRRRLTDPLRRPIFRRLATTYAVNELGDWMGIIALSVLVFHRTHSVLATARLFLRTRFLPPLLAPGLAARGARARAGAGARARPRRPRRDAGEGRLEAAAGRPGRRVRLLRGGDAGRGRLRPAGSRRQGLRLRPDARELGPGNGP